MSNMSYKEQWEIIRSHQKKMPVQMLDLCNAFNIPVKKTHGWPDDISGKIAKNNLKEISGYEIFLNADHPITRRRFTMAHELSHFILHKDKVGNGITDDALYRSSLGGALESEANILAADILMPIDKVKEAIDKGVNTVNDLAKIFWVSDSAMSIRLGVPSIRPTNSIE